MGLSVGGAEEILAAHARPLAEALALRYRVYCEEFAYLPADAYPSGLESDEDDVTAAHFHHFEPKVVDHADVAAGRAERAARTSLAGYVRLVRPDVSGLLPAQRRCHLTLDPGELGDPMTCAEVSRLIIAPEFRRQRCDQTAGSRAMRACSPRSEGHPPATDLLLHLFRQMLAYSRSNGIRYWFAAMERPLARSLAQMGFPFKAAGPEGEFFGRVTPYLADLNDLQHRVAARQPRLAQWLLAPQRAKDEGAFDSTSLSQDPLWAHRPPPPQLWRADC